MKILFLYLITLAAFSQEAELETDTTKLYTTLKEITIFEDMEKTDKFKNCIGKNDLSKEISDENLDNASNCFLSDTSKEDLLVLEKKLGLKNLNLIPDKKAPLIKEYLKKRLNEGLYGNMAQNTSPELGSNKKIKIINQRLFLDLHKNHLINKLSFVQSKFCLKKYATDNSENISEIRKIVKSLEKLKSEKTENLSDIWSECLEKLVNTKCNSLSGNGVKIDWNSSNSDKSICAVKFQIREYRKVLAQIEDNIKIIDSAGESQLSFTDSNIEIYQNGKNGEMKINELSNLTSYDSYKAFEEENPSFFEDNLNEFDKKCAKGEHLNQKDCAEIVNQADMENFNKLKLSVLTEFNMKQMALKDKKREELLNSLEVKMLTPKEKEKLEGLVGEDEIRNELTNILNNYKISLINELNEKMKSKMASSDTLTENNALDEIRFGLKNEREAMMGLTQFHNTIQQYAIVINNKTKEIIGSNALPVQSEIAGIKEFISDKDAHKWIQNSSQSNDLDEKLRNISMDDEFFENFFTGEIKNEEAGI